MKQCRICKEFKDENLFDKHKRGKNGIDTRCKKCNVDDRYKRQNPLMKFTYHKMVEDLSKIKKGCWICGNLDTRICLDHDHKTGKIRGLLCNNCNRSLGLFKDSVDLLKKAIEYLGSQ
jgi:hypothetical protein